MAEWVGKARLMESAPRTGEEFLAYDPVADKFDVVVCDGDQLRSTQMDGEYGPLEDEFQMERATVWYALPDPVRESLKRSRGDG